MTISQIPLSYDQLIGTIQQSRILLIDMMSQLETHTLLNGNSKSFSIGKEESTDSSSPSLIASSEQQYEMVHSILMKNEQETKRLKQHYEDRLKDISNERDQFMRDVLESKFKLENQKTLIEQFKVCTLVSQCLSYSVLSPFPCCILTHFSAGEKHRVGTICQLLAKGEGRNGRNGGKALSKRRSVQERLH